MAATAKGSVFRPTKRKGLKTRFYWVKYRDAQGNEKRHALKLPNGDGVTDKSVAQALLREIVTRAEREAAGLIDKAVEAAGLPVRTLVGRYVRHLRRNGVTRDHIKQVRAYLKWIVEHTDMKRLADFNEDRIDRALGMVAAKGRSPRTVNVYRRCARSFAEWCVKVARVLDRNPVDAVGVRNEAVDRRKERRSMSVAEARCLLDVCGKRRLFYAVQLWTGLRVSEVAALRWGDIEPKGDRPCIRLRAATTKSKRADVVPLHPDLADALAKAHPGSTTAKVFRNAPRLRTLKSDLERAGIEFRDPRGRTVDRHALRTTFITWLGLFGVDPRAQIRLARHAPTGITLKHYQDFDGFDLFAEIRKLPGIPQGESEPSASTAPPVVPQVVPTGGISQLRVATNGTHTENGQNGRNGLTRFPDASKHVLAPTGTFGAERFELSASCSQSRRANRAALRPVVTYQHNRLCRAYKAGTRSPRAACR